MKIDENKYKLTADSNRKNLKYPIVKTFTFNSSMDVRKHLIENKIVNKLYFENLDELCEYVRNNFTVLNEE